MRFSAAVIAYLLSFLICVVLPLAITFIAKKKQKKISALHFLFGLLVFIVALVAYYLVLRYHLTAQDDIGAYYNTAFYRVTIISLITVFLSVLLWIFAINVYSKRQMSRACISFFAGFGCIGCAMLGVYSLLMLLVLVFQYLSSTLLSFDMSLQAFHFSPDVYISVFTPIFGHVSYSVAFIAFWMICLCFALVLCRMATAQIPLWKSVAAFIGLVIPLTALVNIIVFMNMFNFSHYVLGILAVICVLLSLTMVLITYKSNSREEKGYQKQFE